MKGISNKVLIEPSLIVAENSIYRTLEAVQAFSRLEPQFEFYYPQSLSKLIQKPEWYEERWAPKYFLSNAYPSKPAEIRRFFKNTKEVVSGFQVKAEQREKHRQFYEILRAGVRPLWRTLEADEGRFNETRGTFGEQNEAFEADEERFNETREIFGEQSEAFDEDIINILFEEWVFLNESSWIVSRIKQPFTKFMNIGGSSIQFSKRATDTIIRKTLKKTDDELLSKVDRLRTFGKWVAVGGPPVLSFIDPLFSLTSLPAGFFLLFDP